MDLKYKEGYGIIGMFRILLENLCTVLFLFFRETCHTLCKLLFIYKCMEENSITLFLTASYLSFVTH